MSFRPSDEKRHSALFDGVLARARELMCDCLDEAIAGMLDKADEALMALIKGTDNREQWRILEEAKDVVLKQRESIETLFQESYLEDFQRRTNQARRLGEKFAGLDDSAGQLALVGVEDLDETLKFNEMAAKLRAYCDEELSALDQRVGVLLGDANLETKDNPFSPQVICDAYKYACRQLEVDAKVRRVLLKLFDDHVLDAIRSVYKDVNALLVSHAILPKIRYNVARNPDQASPAVVTLPTPAPVVSVPATEIPAVAAKDLFSVLQSLVAASTGASLQPPRGGGGTGVAGAAAGPFIAGAAAGPFIAGAPADAGVAGAPAGASVAPGAPAPAGGTMTILQGAELLGALTRIQRGDLSAVAEGTLSGASGLPGTVNVLHEIKTSSVGAGMGQLDLLTLDIIAMLFDQLFDDPKVPNGVKGLIGRLQIPMLKVAIADKSFFSTKTHPARRMLDALGDIALRLPADFSTASPLFERLQNLLQEVVDGFQDNLDIFTTAREKLHALMAEEDQRVERESQAAAKRAEEMEKLAHAKSIAQQEIKSRVQTHRVPNAVQEFLAQHWLKLLLLIHVKAGTESQPWKDALETMDLLIWSVEPKSTQEDRRTLGTIVPRLIKRLTAGLKALGAQDDVRTQFFAQLMDLHTQALGASGQGEIVSAASAKQTADQPGKVLDGTLRTAGDSNADTPAPDYSAPITVPNPFGGGEVSVECQDLDFTSEAAKGARAKREASISRALDLLKVGSWVEFREPDEPDARRLVRLIFVSPRKTRYLFAAERGSREIIQCTRAEIGRRFRIGEAVALAKAPEESLFDRIINGLLAKLRTPGQAPQYVH